MSDTTRAARGLAALALTGAALVAFSGSTLALPPEPSAGVTASCTNDPTGGGNYTQYVDVTIDAVYKGRWVDFRVTATVPGASNSPKSRTIVRHDSTTSWTDTLTFLTFDSPATSASIVVQALDNKGVEVGSPEPWSGSCTTAG